MKLIVLAMIGLALIGCSGEEVGYRVKTMYNCETAKEDKRANFILNCIANANPKSDEEPEDWIGICQNMSLDTFCTARQVKYQVKKDCYSCFWYATGVEE